MGKKLRIPVIVGRVLGVKVCRGYAKASDLARVSRGDVYDKKTNPTGTQRDLSPKHAKDAYEYIRNRDFGFWPEVFLSVRDEEAVRIVQSGNDRRRGNLVIDENIVKNSKKICISRLDGNHRLQYADGKHQGYQKIDAEISFCMATDLTLEDEITLFRDINNNQRRMNTSHLDNIEVRLSEDDKLKRKNPELYIATKLANDETSPFFQMVYEGGKKTVGSPIPLRTLKSGLTYMFSRQTKLTALDDVEAQYKVIANYFQALKKWEPDAWEDHKSYLMLRGAGLWGVCFLGAEVIDRALANGRYSVKEMLNVLESGKDWDWSNEGDFKGLSGRGGAVKISDSIASEFVDKSGVSIRSLARQIVGS